MKKSRVSGDEDKVRNEENSRVKGKKKTRESREEK